MNEAIETIKNYLKDNLAQGYLLDDLRRTLVESGYSAEDVELAVGQLNVGAPAKAQAPTGEDQQSVGGTAASENFSAESDPLAVQAQEQKKQGLDQPGNNEQMLNYFENKVKRTGFLIVAGGVALLIGMILIVYFFVIR